MIRHIYLGIICLLFLTCKLSQKADLYGDWIISKINISGVDQPLNKLLSFNTISFNKDNLISLPLMLGAVEKETANWELIKEKKSLRLIINSENFLFRDTFIVNFLDTKRNELILSQGKVRIVCVKAFYDRQGF